MVHEVKLEVFEGPLDLLLHLITRQRVDIYEVSLSAITDEYLAVLGRMESLDLESATGFLVVAATLLELKSARLLPNRNAEDADPRLLEERDLLLARLIECATFHEAGAYISGRLTEGLNFHGRSVALEEHLINLVPDLLAKTTVEHLHRAAERAFEPRPEPVLDMSHVAPIRASVRDAIVELADRLTEGRTLTFEELCGRDLERIEVVVRFLALLELFKAGAVEMNQAERFGAITAYWTGEVEAREVAEEAEEYVVRAEGAR